MQVIVEKNDSKRVKKVKTLIESAGNKMGNIWFIRRRDGKLRRMSYRLHVSKPSYAPVPKGKSGRKYKKINREHNLITVFDCNVMRYNKEGRLCGRGEYKSVPLDNVIRVSVGGIKYKIVK